MRRCGCGLCILIFYPAGTAKIAAALAHKAKEHPAGCSFALWIVYGLTGEVPSKGISPQAARTKPSTAQPSME